MSVYYRSTYTVKAKGKTVFSRFAPSFERKLDKKIRNKFFTAFQNANVEVSVKRQLYKEGGFNPYYSTKGEIDRTQIRKVTGTNVDVDVERIVSPAYPDVETAFHLNRFFLSSATERVICAAKMLDNQITALVYSELSEDLSFLSGYNKLSRLAWELGSKLPKSCMDDFAKIVSAAYKEVLESARALLFLRENNDYNGFMDTVLKK